MNDHKRQHIIPGVYLRQFCTPNKKGQVFCLELKHKYEKRVRLRGVNEDIFKKEHYYSDFSKEDPLTVENFLSKKLETPFNSLIAQLKTEKPLEVESKEKIIKWIYYSKLRTSVFRDKTNSVIKKHLKDLNEQDPDSVKIQDIEEFSEKSAKELQLNLLSPSSDLEDFYYQGLSSKFWTILKSKPDFSFFTNDNPGFSCLNAKADSFHPMKLAEQDTICFFVLSPTYCVKMEPFSMENLHLNVFTVVTRFREASYEEIDLINKGVFKTANELIISNNKSQIEKCIKGVNTHKGESKK